MTSSKMNRPTRDVASPIAVEGRFVCSLRSAASAALMGLAMLSASTSALAGIPQLDASVTSLVSGAPGAKVISYSTGDTTYQSAYKVHIANPITNGGLNNIFFTLVTSVRDPVTLVPNGMTAAFIDPAVTGCTPSLNNTRLDCVFGPLPSGSPAIEFTLLVTSPTVVPPTPDSKLAVSWTIQAGQGQANSSNLVYDLSELVTLKVGSAKDGVQSYVLANQTLSVEEAGAETKVKTPKPVTVGVKQVVPGSSCSPQNKKCFESTVTIVDTSSGVPVEIPFTQADPLQIDLFRPVSSLKKGAKFANATLLYKSGGGAWVPIPTCELAVVPASPTQLYAIPESYPYRCITPQKLPYATNGETGVDAIGNWYFHILGLFNGTTDW